MKETVGLIAVIVVLAILLLPHYHSADPASPPNVVPSAAATR